jgi:V/A-type H+-transporting ATPase subunit D
MPTVRVPPGRAGLLWLRHRLGVARRGLDLLQRKQVILLQEAHRLRMLREVTGREWRDADREGRRRLVRAAALGGDRAVRLAVPSARAVLKPRWTSVIGVAVPAEPVLALPDPDEGAAPAAAAYRRALAAAARHAAVAAAHTAVEDEITITRQRVQALERRWIPQLETASAGIQLQMAELEDADAVRRRRALRTDGRRGDGHGGGLR